MIFLYSFSGGQERGATSEEIKRSATTLQNPPALVAEVLPKLCAKLYYLQHTGDKYFFSTQANLNHIVLVYMENVKDEEIQELERRLVQTSVKGKHFKTFVWEDKSPSVPDTEEMKLIILKKKDESFISEIMRTKGQTPRVYRNTVFFLCPLEAERSSFVTELKRKIAFDHIDRDSKSQTLRLTEEQKKEVSTERKKGETSVKEAVRDLYCITVIPKKDGTEEKNLGRFTHGMNQNLDEEVYNRLRMDREILEKTAPLFLREKYLTGKDWVLTDQLYQTGLKTPGEPRPVNRSVLAAGISEGVRMGLFGLGMLNTDQPECLYFRQEAVPCFSEKEILIRSEICENQKKESENTDQEEKGKYPLPDKNQEQETIKDDPDKNVPPHPETRTSTQISLKFEIPKGKVSGIMGVMNLLHSRFDILEISLQAKNGAISQQEMEDKIEETFRQLGISVAISKGEI